MRMHHLWLALPYQIDKRTDHSRVRHSRMEWSLGISIESAERPAPAANPMYRDVAVNFGMGTTRPS